MRMFSHESDRLILNDNDLWLGLSWIARGHHSLIDPVAHLVWVSVSLWLGSCIGWVGSVLHDVIKILFVKLIYYKHHIQYLYNI